MARLSNLLGPGDGEASRDADDTAAPIICRPARRAEIESGLRLILADASGPAGDEAVLDFLGFALQRKIDVNTLWLAEHDGRIVWALMPLVSPGRTMLLFTPGRLFSQTPPRAVRLLCDAVCAHYATSQRLLLAQLLLDPAHRAIRQVYQNIGFEDLAELLYLHRSVHRAPPARETKEADGWIPVTYSPDTHALFADTIARSYEASLDCPALNGRRHIDDIIAGHRATGTFDPSMWFVLKRRDADGVERGAGAGVLLLNPTTTCDSVELVYLGVPPAARGKGIGDQLMRLALGTTAQRQFRDLTLAVDSRNAPALKLYHRHGLQRVASRQALVRDLSRD